MYFSYVSCPRFSQISTPISEKYMLTKFSMLIYDRLKAFFWVFLAVFQVFSVFCLQWVFFTISENTCSWLPIREQRTMRKIGVLQYLNWPLSYTWQQLKYFFLNVLEHMLLIFHSCRETCVLVFEYKKAEIPLY